MSTGLVEKIRSVRNIDEYLSRNERHQTNQMVPVWGLTGLILYNENSSSIVPRTPSWICALLAGYTF